MTRWTSFSCSRKRPSMSSRALPAEKFILYTPFIIAAFIAFVTIFKGQAETAEIVSPSPDILINIVPCLVIARHERHIVTRCKGLGKTKLDFPVHIGTAIVKDGSLPLFPIVTQPGVKPSTQIFAQGCRIKPGLTGRIPFALIDPFAAHTKTQGQGRSPWMRVMGSWFRKTAYSVCQLLIRLSFQSPWLA